MPGCASEGPPEPQPSPPIVRARSGVREPSLVMPAMEHLLPRSNRLSSRHGGNFSRQRNFWPFGRRAGYASARAKGYEIIFRKQRRRVKCDAVFSFCGIFQTSHYKSGTGCDGVRRSLEIYRKRLHVFCF